MENITSKSNQKIKYIKSLNERKFRQKYSQYYLEGIKVVNELLDMYNQRAIDILSIACSYDILNRINGGASIINRLEKIDNFEILNMDSDIFKTITDTVSPQGILAVLNIPKNNIDNINIDTNILILDKLQDAGNVGTIIRTADSFNVKTIICLEGTTDIFSPKVLRSTMASILRVNVIFINNNELTESINKIKNMGYNIIGTSLQTDKYISKNIFKKKCAFVVGNEANGISEEVIKKCDNLVKIPMSSSVESLNVACATSIILYEQFKNN
ncbi:MAG: RNA methyltransferase [Clostridia bacterium]|nr:RNA methyltransferase [Clostridia bacterium]MDD4387144.1 RNA methyltransferase [Clostridia bacterium]